MSNGNGKHAEPETEKKYKKTNYLDDELKRNRTGKKNSNSKESQKEKSNNDVKSSKMTQSSKNNKVNKNSKIGKDGKKKKKFKDRHPKVVTILRVILILIILVIIIIAGIIAGAIWGGYDIFDLFGSDYSINMEDLAIKYENSEVYDTDENLLGELSAGTKRRVISMDQMSEYLPEAYIAIEDERFYEHSGVDFKRTAAATFTYITNGGSSSFGGSTITQQVVKNLTGDDEDTALRKVKEMIKAFQVEHYLSKDQILELYLNLIYVGGDDINGVALGAIYYFDKDAQDLSLAECAYLAGINNSPGLYQPFREFEDENEKNEMTEKINTRVKTVLDKMLELGYISDSEYKDAVQETDDGLAFQKGDTNITTEVSYLTEAAIEQILEIMMEENGWTKDIAEIQLYSGGYSIYTTQDSNVQEILEAELASDDYILVSESGQNSMASMTIIEPTTGYVVGAAARNDDGTTKTYLGYFNLCTDMLKQTGSSIKPLAVTSPGLESGILTASTMFYDGKTTFGGDYEPGEWYDGYKGLVSMRAATAYSMNIPHVKAFQTIGQSTGVRFLQEMNFDDVTGDEGLALALGGFTNGASTLQMAAGYAMIANDGVYLEPVFFTKVVDSNGDIALEAPSVEERSKKMMSESNAYIMKSMLTSVVEGTYGTVGTASYATIPGMEVAAKTGTTNENYDRWLCEFTNYYVGVCWFGYDNKEYVSKSNNYTAGAICSNVMRAIHEDLPESTFNVPDDIVTANVCAESGMLAGSSCTNTYTEIFVDGTIPSVCDVHGNSYRVCNSTGLLASEFCEDYTVKYYRTLPEYERNGKWETKYGSDYLVQIPSGVCTHKAGDFADRYED